MNSELARDLLEKAQGIIPSDRWMLPFPMGVFGTLRSKQCNNRRMHRGNVISQHKAFMPHFIAKGLSISFSKGSSAPFEVFFYDNDEWQKMIPGVDSLESFSPKYAEDKIYGYYRTLAWLRLLPEDFDHKMFSIDLWGTRDLKMPEAEWNNYEAVPCWVYSSVTQNKAAKDHGVIIWG